MSDNPIAEGKRSMSGGSRRHVGGASGAAVKPWKAAIAGVSPYIPTMYPLSRGRE
jgi:hypothetical protein